MPDEDKNFSDSLVLDFRKWWHHVQAKNFKWKYEKLSSTIYILQSA